MPAPAAATVFQMLYGSTLHVVDRLGEQRHIDVAIGKRLVRVEREKVNRMSFNSVYAPELYILSQYGVDDKPNVIVPAAAVESCNAVITLPVERMEPQVRECVGDDADFLVLLS